MIDDWAGGAFGTKSSSGGGGDAASLEAADFIVDPSGGYTTIQAALDAVGNNGGTIFVRAGTYTQTSSLEIKKSNTRLILSGGAIVQCNGSSVSPLIKPTTTGLSRIYIQGGKWLQTTASAVGTCFDFSDCSDSIFMPTRIEEFDIGVKLDDTTNATFYNRYRDIQFFNCNTCLQIGVTSTSTQPNDNYFEALRCRPKAGGAGYGVRIADARGLTFTSCDFEPATAAGITGVSLEQNATSLGFAREVMFINCWIENNVTGVNIVSGVSRATFLGCSITSNTTDIVDAGTSTLFLNSSKTGSTVTSQWVNVAAKTQAVSPYTVPLYENTRVYTNEGATAGVTFNLPTAVAGLTYNFVVQDADGVTVVASTGDTIRLAGSVSATAGNAASTTIGSTLTLVAINATEWIATSFLGTWVVT